MWKALQKVFNLFEVYLPALIFIQLIVTVAGQVFSRYVLNQPLPKFFELSLYSFVWIIYLGAPLAKRYRKHMRFDVLSSKLPKKVQLLIDIFFDLLVNVIFGLLLIPTIQYASWLYKIKTSTLRIPWTYLALCFPLFLILIMVHNCIWIYKNICELLGKEELKNKIKEENPPWQ
jgi:TRAP-type C4-dicarboxylate transport system permease small subunit